MDINNTPAQLFRYLLSFFSFLLFFFTYMFFAPYNQDYNQVQCFDITNIFTDSK